MKKTSNNKKVLWLIMAGFLYAAYLLSAQQIEMYKFNKQIKDNNDKITQQEKEIQALVRDKEKYRSDDYIEKIAREKLGYVKPGEKVYIDRIQQ